MTIRFAFSSEKVIELRISLKSHQANDFGN
jgi:hypothetical protein